MTNFIKKITGAVLGAMLVFTPALAATEITNDYGGSIVEYIQKYNDIKKAEGKLKLDGFCISACTLFLGIVPLENICSTSKGLFGFHSAYIPGYGHSSEGTRLLGHIYPDNVNERLVAEGFDAKLGQEHPNLIYVKGTDFLKACDAPLAS